MPTSPFWANCAPYPKGLQCWFNPCNIIILSKNSISKGFCYWNPRRPPGSKIAILLVSFILSKKMFLGLGWALMQFMRSSGIFVVSVFGGFGDPVITPLERRD